jgi:hypothetical protein
MLVGAAIGGLAFAWGAERLAVLIWIVAGLIGVITFSSQKARTGVGKFFALVGRGLGWLLGIVLLTPVYLIGFTAARIVGRLAGRDPLHLRDTSSQTFWLPADQDRRKVRHIRSLYATETRAPAGGWGVILLISFAGLVVAAEIVLRSLGFGNAILYQPDARVGYYPAPNQQEHRYGGMISTNSYGMRAPEFAAEKEAGTLRILMLGDSTLYGGSYINQDDLYARQLADALEKQFGKGKVEVLNMAANGWGPFNELGFVEKFGTFDADVAVICLPIGDVYRDLAQLMGLPYFTVRDPPRLALEEILRHLNWRSREMFRDPPSAEETAKRGLRGIAAYVELAQTLRDRGCELLFEVLPSSTAGMTDTAPVDELQAVAALRAALQPLGIAVGYPVGLFQNQGTEDEIYHDRVHLHTGGHRAYAKYLDARLNEQSVKLRAQAHATAAATEAGSQ